VLTDEVAEVLTLRARTTRGERAGSRPSATHRSRHPGPQAQDLRRPPGPGTTGQSAPPGHSSVVTTSHSAHLPRARHPECEGTMPPPGVSGYTTSHSAHLPRPSPVECEGTAPTTGWHGVLTGEMAEVLTLRARTTRGERPGARPSDTHRSRHPGPQAQDLRRAPGPGTTGRSPPRVPRRWSQLRTRRPFYAPVVPGAKVRRCHPACRGTQLRIRHTSSSQPRRMRTYDVRDRAPRGTH